MKAIRYMLAGGIGLAAVAAATPASAQYYPPYGGGGNVIGQVLGQILNPGYGGGYGGAYGGAYGGMNSQVMVDRCAAAVTDRVNRQYGGYAQGGYGGYNQYGYNNMAGGARVVAITSVERRSNSKVRVRGIAQSAAYGGGGYGYNAVPQEFSFKCNVDYRGYISDIDLDRTNNRYGYNSPYQSYGTYRRY